MADPQQFGDLAVLAGLEPDHPLARLAADEYGRLMRRLGGEASEREMWLVMLCVQRAVEFEASRGDLGPR